MVCKIVNFHHRGATEIYLITWQIQIYHQKPFPDEEQTEFKWYIYKYTTEKKQQLDVFSI